MPADVSGLVQMLATQPGQQMARLGQSLAQAEESFRKQKQQEFENKRTLTKDALETALINKKITQSDLETMKTKSEIATPIAGKILMTKDPIARQQTFEDSIPTLQKIGVTSEGIEEMRANLGNNDYWSGKVAEGLSAKDIYALRSGTGGSPTIAAKKKAELIQAAKDRGEYTSEYDYVAEGIAYGAYKQFQDQTTGDIVLRDNRTNARVSPEQSAEILPQLPSESQYGKPEEVVVRKGNKAEILLQKNVKELSRDMGKTGAPRLENVLSGIESIVESTYGKGNDLPGFGATALAPDWAISQDAQDLRQASVKLFNIELAERSGAAVTKQELDRLKDEFKSGAWRTDRQFVEGIKAYRSLLESYKGAVFSGYDDKVKSRYWGQGGLALKGVSDGDDDGEVPPTITEEQIRADAKEYGWSDEETEAAIKQYVSGQ